jgi:hypothetical protein
LIILAVSGRTKRLLVSNVPSISKATALYFIFILFA